MYIGTYNYSTVLSQDLMCNLASSLNTELTGVIKFPGAGTTYIEETSTALVCGGFTVTGAYSSCSNLIT